MPTLDLKTYLNIAFGLLVVVFLWWVYHAGEKRIEAADARAAQAQEIHNAEVNQQAQAGIQAAEEHYRALYTAPPLAPVHISLCDATSASAVPSTPADPPRPNAAANVPAAVGPNRDIGPATDHLLDEADAQIVALQAIVRAQQQQMENARAK